MPKPTLPKGWNQVSLEQFIELRQLKGEDGVFNHNIDILCTLTDGLPDDFDDIDIADVGEIFKELPWLYTEPSKLYTDRIGKFYLKPMTDLTLR